MRLSIIPISAALLAACGGGSDGGSSSSTTSWHANISGIGPFASMRGTSDVELATSGQSFAVTVEIINTPPGSYPWHVHFGTCADTGAIVGATVYPELAVGNDGSAMANVTVAAPLDAAVPYSVNLHLAPDDLATIIACGDLALQGGGGGGGGGDGGGDDDGGGY